MPPGRQGQAVEPTKSAMLVGGACGWGLGMPAPVGQIPSTLGVVGERGSHDEGRLPAVPGHSRWDLRDPVAPWRYVRARQRESADAASASQQFGRASEPLPSLGDGPKGGMMEQERPRVVLRGPGDGDAMVLTMGPHRAHITRKAARTETGGHWAVGEAWQDPGFDNPPHTHDEAEAFYVLEGSYTFYTDAESVEEVGPGTFVFIPPGAVHGFRTGPQGGKLICFWPSTVEAAFFNDRTDGGSR